MKFSLKKLFIPSGQKIEVDAYVSWTVRWYKIHSSEYMDGRFSLSTTPESEIFPTIEDANKFAAQLRESHKLLRTTGDLNKITVTANQ